MEKKDLLLEEAQEWEVQESAEPGVEPEMVKRRSRKRNIIIFAVVMVLNVALLGLLFSQLLTPASSSQNGVTFSNTTTGYIPSPLLGKPAPDFTLPLLNGGSGSDTLQLRSLKGKPVIVNFWSSTCDPCKEESPFLSKMWPKLQAQGIMMVGVDVQEFRDGALKFLQKYGLTHPNVQDDLNGDTGIAYGVSGYPETIFINSDGVVKAKFIGALDEKSLQVGLAEMQR